MKKFILLTFLFLGWVLYEFSGGADFKPEAPLRLARIEAENAARAEAQQTPEITQSATEVESTSPETTDVQLVSVDVSDSQAVLASAAVAISTAPSAQPVSSNVLFSTPSATPTSELAVIRQPELGDTQNAELPAASPAVDVREVRSSRVNMRNGPGTQYSVLSKLKRGDQVKILQEPGNGWVKLKVIENGRIGWMSASLLTKVD